LQSCGGIISPTVNIICAGIVLSTSDALIYLHKRVTEAVGARAPASGEMPVEYEPEHGK
jgi:hypothetical protein